MGKEDTIDFAEALDVAGSWGRYQYYLYLVVFSAGIPNAFVMMHFVYTQYAPSHHCAMPVEYGNFMTNDTELLNSITRSVIPVDADGKLSICEMFDRNYTQYPVEDWPGMFNDSSASKVACTNGMAYNLSKSEMTATMDFDMVCDKDWVPPLGVTMFNIGSLIGALCSTIADMFGRRPMYIAACILQVVSMVMLAFSWNYAFYLFSVGISGLSGFVNYVIAFVLASELSSPRWRNFMCIGTMYSFTVGYCVVPGIAALFPHWRWFMGATSVLCALIYLPGWWCFPESPRWLAQKGESEKAKKILMMIAKFNGNTDDFNALIEKRGGNIVENSKEASVGYFRSIRILLAPGMRARYLVCISAWFVFCMIYYAISLYSTEFSSDRYLNVLYAGLTEFPAYKLIYFGLDWIGRPRPMSFVLLLCGISSVSLPFISTDTWIPMVLSIIGKCSVTAGFYAVYLTVPEVVPTLQRSTAMGVCSAAARLGALSVPFLMYLRKYNEYAPNVAMGVTSILSGLAVIYYLPETMDVGLPETLEDAKGNNRIYRFNLCKRWPKDVTSSQKIDGQEMAEQQQIKLI